MTNNPLEQLRDMTQKELKQWMDGMNDEEFDDWLISAGLLHSFQTCDTCGEHMTLQGRNRVWVCNRRACRQGNTKPTKGILAGTFFEEAHEPRKRVFLLSYLWLQGRLTVKDIEYEHKISHNAIVYWMDKFRKICSRYFDHHPIGVGGNNVVVEVDETYITARHGRRGRWVRRHPFWIFGGIERGSGLAFLIPVPDRKAVTLLQLIWFHVRPGILIFHETSHFQVPFLVPTCGELTVASVRCHSVSDIGPLITDTISWTQ